jgi:hypothetical protein
MNKVALLAIAVFAFVCISGADDPCNNQLSSEYSYGPFLRMAEDMFRCFETVPLPKKAQALVLETLSLFYNEYNSAIYLKEERIPPWYDQNNISQVLSDMRTREFGGLFEFSQELASVIRRSGDGHSLMDYPMCVSYNSFIPITALPVYQDDGTLIFYMDQGPFNTQSWDQFYQAYGLDTISQYIGYEILLINGMTPTKYATLLITSGRLCPNLRDRASCFNEIMAFRSGPGLFATSDYYADGMPNAAYYDLTLRSPSGAVTQAQIKPIGQSFMPQNVPSARYFYQCFADFLNSTIIDQLMNDTCTEYPDILGAWEAAGDQDATTTGAGYLTGGNVREEKFSRATRPQHMDAPSTPDSEEVRKRSLKGAGMSQKSKMPARSSSQRSGKKSGKRAAVHGGTNVTVVNSGDYSSYILFETDSKQIPVFQLVNFDVYPTDTSSINAINQMLNAAIDEACSQPDGMMFIDLSVNEGGYFAVVQGILSVIPFQNAPVDHASTFRVTPGLMFIAADPNFDSPTTTEELLGFYQITAGDITSNFTDPSISPIPAGFARTPAHPNLDCTLTSKQVIVALGSCDSACSAFVHSVALGDSATIVGIGGFPGWTLTLGEYYGGEVLDLNSLVDYSLYIEQDLMELSPARIAPLVYPIIYDNVVTLLGLVTLDGVPVIHNENNVPDNCFARVWDYTNRTAMYGAVLNAVNAGCGSVPYTRAIEAQLGGFSGRHETESSNAIIFGVVGAGCALLLAFLLFNMVFCCRNGSRRGGYRNI